MKKPGTAVRLTAMVGVVALVGLGAMVLRSADAGAPSVEVRAGSRAGTGTGPAGTDTTDPMPTSTSSSPTSTSTASSSTTATTLAAKPTTTTTKPRPTTTTAPTTTTTTAMVCAPAAPQFVFGLLRGPDGRGWAGGGNPALQHSTDGGATWTPACVQADAVTGGGGFFGIAFAADGIHGWATGGTNQQPLALRTVDGGDHWLPSTLPAGMTGHLGGVSFAGPSHGWTVGSRTGTGPANAAGGYVLATIDGGRTWTAQDVPSNVGRLNRIVFADTTHGWAIGVANDGGPALIGTTDGGATWVSQSVPDTVHTLRDVAFLDATRGWAVGQLLTMPGSGSSPGVILTTTDGGATWTQQATTARDLWTVGVVDAQTVFAGGGYGLWSTRDGGASWDEQPFALPALDVMSFADATDGWVSHSMFSVVCRTDDGGRTWTPSDVRPGKAPAAGCTK